MTSTSPDPRSEPIAGNARLLDGVTGTEHRIAAVVEIAGLRLIPTDRRAAEPLCPLIWPWSETYAPASAGGKRVFATTAAPDARLTVLAPKLAGEIRGRCGGDARATPTRPGIGRRRPGAGMVIAVTLLAVLLVVLALAPVSAAIARLLPVESGAAVSDAAVASLGRAHGRCLRKQGRDAIDSLAKRLAKAARIAPPVVTVIDWGVVNAFAMPGQRIVLTAGLIHAAEDPSEIAAVLAHEIGHVAHRDPTTRWIRTEGVGLLMTAVFGASTTGGVVESLAGGLLDARYTRAQEEAADGAALEYLRAAGIRSTGGARFFERLAKTEPNGALGDVIDLISTHPGSPGRAALFAEAGTGAEPGLDDTQFKALKRVCTLTRPR